MKIINSYVIKKIYIFYNTYLGGLVVVLEVFFDFEDLLPQSVYQVLERTDIFLEDLSLTKQIDFNNYYR